MPALDFFLCGGRNNDIDAGALRDERSLQPERTIATPDASAAFALLRG